MAGTATPLRTDAATAQVELELHLVGALLASAAYDDGAQWPKVANLCVPQDFMEPILGECWRVFQQTDGRATLEVLLGRFPNSADLLVTAFDRGMATNAPTLAREVADAGLRRALGTLAASRLTGNELSEAAAAVLSTVNRDHSGLGPVQAVTGTTLLEQPLVPRPWLVPDLIPCGTVTTLDGDGGTGKSTLALQLAAAASAGKPWLNRPVLQGPAVFVSAEDDADELRRRLHNIATHMGADAGELAGLHIFAVADREPELATLDARERRLSLTPMWSELEAAVTQLRPVVVVLDSRADLFGGDEVNRAQVRAFIGLLRRLASTSGAAVLMLSHPSLTGLSSGSGSSGSTAWNNSVRSRLYFSRPKSDDGGDYDPDARVLSHKKANYSAQAADMRLYRRGGVFVTDDTGRAPTSLDRRVQQDRTDALFLNMLAAFSAQGRNVSHAPQANNFAPAMFAQDGRAAGTTKAGFRQAMDRLFAAGRIRVEPFGPPSKRRERIVAVMEGAE